MECSVVVGEKRRGGRRRRRRRRVMRRGTSLTMILMTGEKPSWAPANSSPISRIGSLEHFYKANF